MEFVEKRVKLNLQFYFQIVKNVGVFLMLSDIKYNFLNESFGLMTKPIDIPGIRILTKKLPPHL